MFKYVLYYDGGFLRDSSDTLEEEYETEEEALEAAQLEVESRIEEWELEGCEYDPELFSIDIKEI